MLLEKGDRGKKEELGGLDRGLCPPMPAMTALEGTRGAFHLLLSKSLGTGRQENKQDAVQMGFPLNISKISALSRAS